MTVPSRQKHITRLSYDLDDLSLMEDFHEATKFFPATLGVDLPRIVSYLTESRALLEVSRNRKNYRYSPVLDLPAPFQGSVALDRCLAQRHSVQRFRRQPLSLQALSNVLSDAIAPTQESVLSEQHGYRLMKRPYASGGGLYPIELYPILLNVADQPVTVTHYDPFRHALNIIATPERQQVLDVCHDIDTRLEDSGAILIFTAVLERTTVKYGMRGYRFALLEAGQMAQTISLCAVSRRLGTLPWGGYHDDDVADLLKVDNVVETVVHCMAIGEALA